MRQLLLLGFRCQGKALPLISWSTGNDLEDYMLFSFGFFLLDLAELHLGMYNSPLGKQRKKQLGTKC